MYCRNCYTNLSLATNSGICPKCKRKFDAANHKTFLDRPFPNKSKIALQIILTTVFGVGAAFVVAVHQLARTSGH